MTAVEERPEASLAEAQEYVPRATLDPNELRVIIAGYELDLRLAIAASKRALLLAHARYARRKSETDQIVPSFRLLRQRGPSEA